MVEIANEMKKKYQFRNVTTLPTGTHGGSFAILGFSGKFRWVLSICDHLFGCVEQRRLID